MLARERSAAQRLESATGKPISHWIALAKRSAHSTFQACAAWLVEEHGLSRMHAQWIASYALSDEDPTEYEDPTRLVDALYSGTRASLRELHEAIVDRILALGPDVVVTACKTMVPAYRKHVFAELRPKDAAIEVSLALGDAPARGRLEIDARKNASDRVRHRILVRSTSELDAAFARCLGAAYAQGAGAIARKALPTPADLAKALKTSHAATVTWKTCTPSQQREFIAWIEGAKQAETRARRVATSVEKLATGKKRTY